ncbi:hypothetical protein ACQP1S_00555 [Micromonospora matsumotoense]|uniref:hypothetical protein n=1 Tax=Micromonospora matsumotoense TaxID=121616 RepID=UPI003D8AEC39
MNSETIHAFGVLLLLLAGIIFLSFVAWLMFCYAIARLPNGEVLVRQAPKVIEAFDIRSWGDVLLPWRIVARGFHGIALLATRDPGGVSGEQQGQQAKMATGPADQGQSPPPLAGP